jgi:hypothetical protein
MRKKGSSSQQQKKFVAQTKLDFFYHNMRRASRTKEVQMRFKLNHHLLDLRAQQ